MKYGKSKVLICEIMDLSGYSERAISKRPTFICHFYIC